MLGLIQKLVISQKDGHSRCHAKPPKHARGVQPVRHQNRNPDALPTRQEEKWSIISILIIGLELSFDHFSSSAYNHEYSVDLTVYLVYISLRVSNQNNRFQERGEFGKLSAAVTFYAYFELNFHH